MAIEKMQLVDIVGHLPELDQTLLKCIQSGVFHPENALSTGDKTTAFSAINGENTYAFSLKKLYDLAQDIHAKLRYTEDTIGLTPETADAEIKRIQDKALALSNEKKTLKEEIGQYEQALMLIKHLQGLDVSFDDVFASSYVKVRFGRLPFDSYPKLNFYEKKPFFFFTFDHDSEYYWGVYFAPATQIDSIDEIFRSLYFERLRVPDYAHNKPEIAIEQISGMLESDKNRLVEVRKQLADIKQEELQCLNACFTVLKAASDTFAMRKYVAVSHNSFYLEGFVPERDARKFSDALNGIEGVSCVLNPVDANPALTPPTKLRNKGFSKPFQMFVGMYGLPSYHDFDPTTLVAITYTLMFGVMFGDLGQGLVLALVGLFLGLVKKMDFGRIIFRLGISSAIFGTLYGSVFGYEDWLDPMWEKLGCGGILPLKVFEASTTNKLLLAAIFIGVGVICIAMIINICIGFKHKDYERAVFGNNGIAGLTLYMGAVIAIAGLMLYNINVLSPWFIICVIVIPVLLIFLREPLGKMAKKRKDIKPADGIGTFILENFFEMFEYVLSYLSNTMSFLRVGGFILSHAGMMAVVMSLSEMMSGGGTVVVMVIGNIFVMCLEGLIVGIQVLRLEFYEIFSRFYNGDGKEYEPATISYKVE